jgi:hypothetical protein
MMMKPPQIQAASSITSQSTLSPPHLLDFSPPADAESSWNDLPDDEDNFLQKEEQQYSSTRHHDSLDPGSQNDLSIDHIDLLEQDGDDDKNSTPEQQPGSHHDLLDAGNHNELSKDPHGTTR